EIGGVLLDDRLRIGTDTVAVIVVENILHVLVEDVFVNVGFRGRGGCGGRVDGHAGGSGGGTSVAGGGQRVGGGLGGVHVARSRSGHRADAFNLGGVGVGGVPGEHGALSGVDGVRLGGNVRGRS